MTEQELERRLQGYFHAETDGEAASGSLLATIAAIPEELPASPLFGGRGLLLLVAAGLILALLAGTALAAGSGLIEMPWQDSPHLINQAPTSPAPSLTAATVNSVEAWTTLDLQPVQHGFGLPPGSYVVSWSGGYLALFQGGNADYIRRADPVGAGPLDAWTSRDGRTWTELSADTFRPTAFRFGAAPAFGGVVVITESAQGSRTTWFSRDGATWTSSPAPAMKLTGSLWAAPPPEVNDNDVAGSPSGIVALSAIQGSIEFSADGQSWQTVALPGAGFDIAGVEALGSGFVAVGRSTTTSDANPVAWWSDDGLHWTATDPVARPGEGFADVAAGAGGLVATSYGGFGSGLHSLWRSPDGRSWSLLGEPLAASGEGTSGDGYLEGDGKRLLWFPASLVASSASYLTSRDGISWTKLAVTGDTPAAATTQMTPFQVTPLLMKDGILFIGKSGNWFGSAEN